MTHTCRFCTTNLHGVRMFRYAERHWAHYMCWLDARGREIQDPHIYQGVLQALEGLHDWQLRDFPVLKLADWLQQNNTTCPKAPGPGSLWTSRACWLLQTAIRLSTQQARS